MGCPKADCLWRGRQGIERDPRGPRLPFPVRKGREDGLEEAYVQEPGPAPVGSPCTHPWSAAGPEGREAAGAAVPGVHAKSVLGAWQRRTAPHGPFRALVVQGSSAGSNRSPGELATSSKPRESQRQALAQRQAPARSSPVPGPPTPAGSCQVASGGLWPDVGDG